SELAIFEAIRLASAVNVIVVEAAGNGSARLDNFRAGGQRVLSRGIPGESRESGAIVVGACNSLFPHFRWEFSNFGSRVDCFAWGERIVTTGDSATPTRIDAYWLGPAQERFFGGTSGASAIITGVCLIVQHMKAIKDGVGARLNATDMRRIVS